MKRLYLEVLFVGSGGENVSELQKKTQSLQNQLEEYKRWNTSLQARLSQEPTHRDGGVGQAHESRKITVRSQNGNTEVPLSNGVSPSYISVETSSNHPKSKYSPGSKISSRRMLDLHDSLPNSSYLPSFMSIDLGTLPTDQDLTLMSVPELKETAVKMRDQIVQTSRENEQLQNCLKNSPLSKDVYVDRLQKSLAGVESQRDRLQRQVNQIVNSSSSDSDQRIIPVLKEQLDEAKETIVKLQQQVGQLHDGGHGVSHGNGAYDSGRIQDLENMVSKMQNKLKEADKVTDALKKQVSLNTKSESHPQGLNPELIVQMAKEIERLKKELKAKENEDVVSAVRKSSSSSTGGLMKSQIPVLQKGTNLTEKVTLGVEAQRALQAQMDSLKAELNDHKVGRIFKLYCLL